MQGNSLLTVIIVCLFEQEMRKKREEELDALQSKLGELNANIEHDELGIKKSLAGIQQVGLMMISALRPNN